MLPGKIKVPDSVLKVKGFTSNFNYKSCNAIIFKDNIFLKRIMAMATVISKKKTKDYEAIYMCKIKAKIHKKLL